MAAPGDDVLPAARKALKARAVYWAPAGTGDSGQPLYADPIELRCRWDETTERFIKANGEETVSSAVVMVDRALEKGGLLRRSYLSQVAYPDDPFKNVNPKPYEIQKVDEVGNKQQTKFFRQAYL